MFTVFLMFICQYIETCLSGHPTHSFKCLQITFFLQGKVFTCRSFLLTIATVRLPVAGGWVGGSPVNTAAGWTFEQAESAGAWKLHYSHHGMTAHQFIKRNGEEMACYKTEINQVTPRFQRLF